jgi:1-acyl-sn-glycerol-3-phosphate acyltransferase
MTAAEPEPGPEPGREPEPTTKAETKPNRVLEAAYRLDNDQTLLVRMVALLARIGARTVARVRVEHIDRIPRTGPVILAVNHISNLDGVVTGAFITDALKRRRIHWLGKREMFDWPLLGWMAAHGGVHPVDRAHADVEAFRLATRILEAGHVLLVFPEGTRSPTGELQEAKDGVAMLALRTGAQILPIGLNNTDAVWKKGSKVPMPLPRRTVTMRVGEPFTLADVLPADVDRRMAKTLATRTIMGRIAELLDPRHRGVYADAVRPEHAVA